MEEKTFYDVHLHAFNLSHPYLRAFIRRFNIHLILPLASVLGWFSFIPFIRNKLDSAMNLLAVMEDDIDSVFLLLENCLREDGLLDNEGLHIGGTTYKKVVLTLRIQAYEKGPGYSLQLSLQETHTPAGDRCIQRGYLLSPVCFQGQA